MPGLARGFWPTVIVAGAFAAGAAWAADALWTGRQEAVETSAGKILLCEYIYGRERFWRMSPYTYCPRTAEIG